MRGIGAARSFILVLSQTSNNSKFVRREVEQADRKDKPIYAVRIEQVDPSDDLQLFLSEIHWIDAWKGDLAAHIKPSGNCCARKNRRELRLNRSPRRRRQVEAAGCLTCGARIKSSQTGPSLKA